jgi:hypothetical protein
MTFTVLKQNLRYYMGVKGDSLVQAINNGAKNDADLHEFNLISNLFDFLLGYDDSGTYSDEFNEAYRQTLLKINSYLETNLAYEFNN